MWYQANCLGTRGWGAPLIHQEKVEDVGQQPLPPRELTQVARHRTLGKVGSRCVGNAPHPSIFPSSRSVSPPLSPHDTSSLPILTHISAKSACCGTHPSLGPHRPSGADNSSRATGSEMYLASRLCPEQDSLLLVTCTKLAAEAATYVVLLT